MISAHLLTDLAPGFHDAFITFMNILAFSFNYISFAAFVLLQTYEAITNY